jgi:hypothetical protein
MQDETFKSRLDTYYLATIVYVVTLVVYAVIRGTLIGDTFSVVWQDPIVYLLAACSVLSLITLIIASVSNRTVIVSQHELRYRTRSKERILTPADIEWIGFRRERSFRGEKVYPSARIKLHNRRRSLRLRPASFERSGILARSIRDFARANNIELRSGRRRGA